EILSCGTCLDYFGLNDKLAVGSVSNMYTIVEKLNQISNITTL
ncbi:MAG: sulfurtransferase-like selenium metabolism protein YedF, partial [Natronincolaceae bacterium]